MVCSSCEFPDYKGDRYFDVCLKYLHIFWEAGEVSFVYVLVTNDVNWHRENLRVTFFLFFFLIGLLSHLHIYTCSCR